MNVQKKKIQFATNGVAFELTPEQIMTVYYYQERQYLKEDAYQAIENYVDTFSHCDVRVLLVSHIDDVIEEFMDEQDQNVANSITWENAIEEIVRKYNN